MLLSECLRANLDNQASNGLLRSNSDLNLLRSSSVSCKLNLLPVIKQRNASNTTDKYCGPPTDINSPSLYNVKNQSK